MSAEAPSPSTEPLAPDGEASAPWWVRRASAPDAPGIAGAVGMLLAELGAAVAPPARELEAAASALAADERAGVLLLAESAEGRLVGLLGASWQLALRIPGEYGLIQELWVDPAWRGRAVGGALLAELVRIARERGVSRLEVGLPGERFARLEATRAFYLDNDFAGVGERMRRLL